MNRPFNDKRSQWTFQSSLDQLSEVRDSIDTLCKGNDKISKVMLSQLKVAVNEVFSNIVKHGYPKDESKPIIIRTTITDQGVHIQISDHGIAFDPKSAKEPDLPAMKEDGYGIYLIRQLCERIDYQQDEFGWNHLSLFEYYQ